MWLLEGNFADHDSTSQENNLGCQGGSFFLLGREVGGGIHQCQIFVVETRRRSENLIGNRISSQILQLLNYEDHLILQQVLRVCCTSIGALLVKKPQLAEKYLITPLQEPLLRTLEISGEYFSISLDVFFLTGNRLGFIPKLLHRSMVSRDSGR